MMDTHIRRPGYLDGREKAAPGGASTPAEGLTKGDSAPMADRHLMEAGRGDAQPVGGTHG
jgi:hypothetical protein